MILGTYHMAGSTDLVVPDAGDALSPQRQAEIADLVARLTTFAPTRVAVEAPASAMTKVNAQFEAYRRGEYTLTRNEIDQVGFRLAAELGLDRLECIDERMDMHLDEVIQFAGEHQPALVDRIMTLVGELESATGRLTREGSVVEILRYMNSTEFDQFHRLYILTAQVGAGENYIGADAVAAWYHRNLRIFANIARLAGRPEERLLVLIGSGHGALLREFIRQAPGLELVDPLPYLA